MMPRACRELINNGRVSSSSQPDASLDDTRTYPLLDNHFYFINATLVGMLRHLESLQDESALLFAEATEVCDRTEVKMFEAEKSASRLRQQTPTTAAQSAGDRMWA